MDTLHSDIIVIGAGAAGLMAARELGRAGKKVTLLEARDRCGGRIYPLATGEFGYPAEGGAEFVHGEAPVTRALLREAGLSLVPVYGTRWNVERGAFSQDEAPDLGADHFHQALAELKADVTVADFLERYFAGPEHSRLRHSIVRMVEGYDAADPAMASILALRDEWMNRGPGPQVRIAGGYGALIAYLADECRKQNAVIHLNSVVSAIEATDRRALVHCVNGRSYTGDRVILTVPLPLLQDIAFPHAVREKLAAAANIGFGNVIKILLRFKTHWWTSSTERDLSDLLFLLSDETIPVWWTQCSPERPVLTGWIAGPKTAGMPHLDENALVETGIASLAGIFGLSPQALMRDLVAARAINWARDPFARGAYSYATPATREAQLALASSDVTAILLSGEALYRGRDMGTVEAALASGLETAQAVVAVDQISTPRHSPVTRQITLPTSSATKTEPSGPSVTPTGRP
ncbi:FAD-dependent oxidoreductase [Bradyrhizobium sp. BRP22]|uniref:flavin monoamine oxidase family protein n=1 Tax=Bradyrhizobium sp. BRP22 TaxID=2793821 RepID=UPI001CD80751|nr:NAD(P)/FAD-dependent oxidoreductase [Bradyrhizobium sp. BRP22]MCA1454639.1 FAD-dependent oxidoreductase [Bradyrhizobium sp. BRP22]